MQRLMMIMIGGVAGAAVRWLVNELLPTTEIPISTLVVNVVGSALLAWVLFGPLSSIGKAAVGIGFCGGLTTFSTFAVELVVLQQDGKVGSALGYLLISLIVGLVSFIVVRDRTLRAAA